ncbi:DUF5928 domain-containing protein [Rhodovulum steppense]|uniref:DUF5928 domain-containing protein n=1 Tax=Rhodovulum steppense TaxID=540251 RepID=UPI0024366FAF|nr:DUF5928 domain-containing protein [Rhodovulum steppense]
MAGRGWRRRRCRRSAEAGGALARSSPTSRREIGSESDRLDEARFANPPRMEGRRTPADNAAPLAQFLSIPYETAGKIAATDQLFAD